MKNLIETLEDHLFVFDYLETIQTKSEKSVEPKYSHNLIGVTSEIADKYLQWLKNDIHDMCGGSYYMGVMMYPKLEPQENSIAHKYIQCYNRRMQCLLKN